jgi:DNA-binding LacI/PurR family transcriptional regulator
VPSSNFVARERQAGWVETLAEAGVTPVVMQVHDNAEPDVSQGARALVADPDRPTAVLCFSDLMAAAVVHAAEDAGLRVPEDISVVGFDDSPLSRRLRPALTTVHQDFDAKGKAAARALTSAIARSRSGAPAVAEQHRILVDLVVRDSTAPPPSA